MKINRLYLLRETLTLKPSSLHCEMLTQLDVYLEVETLIWPSWCKQVLDTGCMIHPQIVK